MERWQEPPPPEALNKLLAVIAPGHRLQAVSPAPGSFSNVTHFVDALSPGGLPLRVVLRRYNPANEDPARKAPREYAALTLLRQHGVPVPEPLYLDREGEVLGAPGIVTSYVPGRQWVGVDHPLEWARTLAQMLARIHAVPWEEAAGSLIDANREVAWFALTPTLPQFLAPHEDAPALWRMARDLWPRLRPVPPTLVHVDFWAGNLLWREGRIAAVLDWEEAGYGNPGSDVAYARMELRLLGLDEAAEEFLRTYEAITGRRVENLGFWELAAAVRSMPDPAGWLPEWRALGTVSADDDVIRHRLRRFIEGALRRAEASPGDSGPSASA